MANFSGHEQRLYCCLWSPADPDVVLSGGEDCCLHAFRVSRQRNRRPQAKVNPAKEFKKRQIKENRKGAQDNNDVNGASDEGKPQLTFEEELEELRKAIAEKKGALQLQAEAAEQGCNSIEILGKPPNPCPNHVRSFVTHMSKLLVSQH